MTLTACSECGYRIKLGAHPFVGQAVRCAKCNARLEVISLAPLELDWQLAAPKKRVKRAVKEDIWEMETEEEVY